MFVKWILFLCFLGCLDAFSPPVTSQPCAYPRIENGRIRMRQKTKLVRFSCYPRYELVGNKYAICRNGKWDVPLPVCVKPGCTFEEIKNGIIVQSRGGAWLMYFCLPGHKRIGSPARYCDGRKWNASSPVCVDSSTPPQLSCDFEDSNLCGWTQDALHDFDWQRLNKGTPSSVLFTGPSHDHTSGKGGLGYYMYIESTGRIRNDTARLLSPVYDRQLSKDGCFSFYYHMYGETTGGLKIYQKPDNWTLSEKEKQNYVIFEKWGNQGDMWLNAVVPLRDYPDDFQIIIEGIRGASFTSDIAIDDVSIQQGDNCSAVSVASTTPREIPDTCAGRCHTASVGLLGCSCIMQCIGNGTCCLDFLDFCVFSQDQNNTPDDMSTTPEELSHQNTQKLVVSSSSEAPPSPTTTTELTTIKTTIPPTKAKTTLASKTPKPTVKLFWLSTTPLPTKKTTKLVVTTKKLPNPTIVFKTTPLIYNATGKLKKDVNKTVNIKPLVTTNVRTTKVTTAIVKKTTTSLPHGISRTIENHDVYHDMVEKAKKEQVEKAKKEQRIETKGTAAVQPIRTVTAEVPKGSSSSVRTGVIVISSLILCAGAVYLVMMFRSARGKDLVARLRGQVCRDQEVRYLTTNVDDDDE